MNLLLRVDANETIGSGHLMRCLALAREWARHGKAIFAMESCSAPLRSLVADHGFSIVGTGRDELASIHFDVVVLDGYHHSHQERSRFADLAATLLVDDHGWSRWRGARAVLDSNLCPGSYQAPCLAGPRYALLRPEFRQPIDAASRRGVMLTFGANAPTEIVISVMDALAERVRNSPSLLPVFIVLGGLQQESGMLESVAKSHAFDVVRDVKNMAQVMAGCAFAISAAGTTLLELAATGTPALLVPIAGNQFPVAVAAQKEGIARACLAPRGPELQRDLAEFLEADHAAMARRGPLLVDGRGVRRVCARLRSWCIQVRPTTDEDKDTVLRWNNDPLMRSVSFHSDPISNEEHEAWWAERRGDANSHLYVGEMNGAVGLVWFRVVNDEAFVSVNVAPNRRGQGLGAALICAAVDVFRKESSIPVVAVVRKKNRASREAFLDADFDELEPRAEWADAWIFRTR